MVITPADVDQYYKSHLVRYTEPESISFFHIYFDAHDKAFTEQSKRANNVLRQIMDNHLIPAQVSDKGDRFLYFKNYKDKSQTFVASHFGEAFSEKLFQLEELETWQGPLRSEHGEHIVWISKKQKEKIPLLQDVYDKVKDDVKAERVNAAVENKIEGIIQKYSIEQRDLVERRQQSR